MIKSAVLLLVLSVILCHFSAEADPPHNPPSDGIVSIRERRGEVPHARAQPHRMRRGMDMNSNPRPYGGR
ncbi:hypothetical protein Ddc_21309 [Ditylenchus destructor]|nr:hypothetical protein Ddc_21309 [Ditylenchus destructor]